MAEQIAVFLDRDGVINELAYFAGSGEYEAPKTRKDFRIFPHTIGALQELVKAGCKLFLITNQPDYAKGKATMEELKAIHEIMHRKFIENGIEFTEYYYCYVHPDAVVPELLGSECRKPKPYMIFEAQKKYNLNLQNAWMVGDQDTDIRTGKAAGAKTIVVEYPQSANRRGKVAPDFTAKDLKEAVNIILGSSA